MLIERIDSRGMARGYGENYIPIQLSAQHLEKNTFINVTLNDILNTNSEDKMIYNATLW